ncbi:MAG TPA: BlaI/MecI/CopY family transcriptional regulator [Terriglobia bacterium]|nr:BlaI/MecI/CopY family transcriptional regulator [Terriglobia bacterium]
MARPKSDILRPTEAELDILNVLWRLGPSTVRQAHEHLRAARDWQYSTTLKLMQVMAIKGLLKRDESERSHVYSPAVGREETQRLLVGRLIDRVFGGSVRSLMLGALDAKRASKRELAELRELIEKQEREKK